MFKTLYAQSHSALVCAPLCRSKLCFFTMSIFPSHPKSLSSECGVLWCAVRSAPGNTQTEGEKQRRCEGTSDLGVSRTVEVALIILQVLLPQTAARSPAHAVLSKDPVKEEKQLDDPLKRHPEEFPHIDSCRKLLETPHTAAFYLRYLIIAKLSFFFVLFFTCITILARVTLIATVARTSVFEPLLRNCVWCLGNANECIDMQLLGCSRGC